MVRSTELLGWITRTNHWPGTVQFTHFVDSEVCLCVIHYYNHILALTQVSEVVLLHDGLWPTFWMFPLHFYVLNVPLISTSWLGHSKDYNNNSWTVHIMNFLIIWHSEDHALWCILIMKANEMHYFSYLFDKVLCMFQTCPLSIIRSISTLYTQQ